MDNQKQPVRTFVVQELVCVSLRICDVIGRVQLVFSSFVVLTLTLLQRPSFQQLLQQLQMLAEDNTPLHASS